MDELKYGGVLWALLSGDKSEIDSNLKRRFQETGTSHLLAISGMHIGLVAACAYVVLFRLLGGLVLLDRFERWRLGIWIKRLSLSGSMIAAIVYGHQVGRLLRRSVLCLWCAFIVLESA